MWQLVIAFGCLFSILTLAFFERFNTPFKCNLNIAAQRRYRELKKKNPKIKKKEVKKALKIRNIMDTKRKNSPLLKHRDSIEIDTGKLNKQAMLIKMSKHIERVIKKKYGNRARN